MEGWRFGNEVGATRPKGLRLRIDRVGNGVAKRAGRDLELLHLTFMSTAGVAMFDEKYRVVAVESQSLTIRGIRSGEVLTIINPYPESPLTPAEYPPGKLIALSDPSEAPLN